MVAAQVVEMGRAVVVALVVSAQAQGLLLLQTPTTRLLLAQAAAVQVQACAVLLARTPYLAPLHPRAAVAEGHIQTHIAHL